MYGNCPAVDYDANRDVGVNLFESLLCNTTATDLFSGFSFTITWSAVDLDGGAVGVKLFRSGVQIGRSSWFDLEDLDPTFEIVVMAAEEYGSNIEANDQVFGFYRVGNTKQLLMSEYGFTFLPIGFGPPSAPPPMLPYPLPPSTPPEAPTPPSPPPPPLVPLSAEGCPEVDYNAIQDAGTINPFEEHLCNSTVEPAEASR